jgi:6-phosphogluconolactonase
MKPANDTAGSNSIFVRILANADALAETVASQWLDELAAPRKQGLPFLVALSGGRITPKFFAAVVTQTRARGISFEHVHFFWADERCVSPTDPASNFGVASEHLFSPLGISAGQIHRLKGEAIPGIAVREASAKLLRLAPTNAAGQPVLDLVLLGMGEDGHVASLFPGAGEDVWNCKTPFLVIPHSPKPPAIRLSMSYAVIAAARQVWVLISGTGKDQALHDSLFLPCQTPLRRVTRLHPGTKIFTDLTISVGPSNQSFEIRS